MEKTEKKSRGRPPKTTPSDLEELKQQVVELKAEVDALKGLEQHTRRHIGLPSVVPE